MTDHLNTLSNGLKLTAETPINPGSLYRITQLRPASEDHPLPPGIPSEFTGQSDITFSMPAETSLKVYNGDEEQFTLANTSAHPITITAQYIRGVGLTLPGKLDRMPLNATVGQAV